MYEGFRWSIRTPTITVLAPHDSRGVKDSSLESRVCASHARLRSLESRDGMRLPCVNETERSWNGRRVRLDLLLVLADRMRRVVRNSSSRVRSVERTIEV